MPITIVELPEFIRNAKNILSEAERNELIYHLSKYPKSGVIIKGTGGIRKLRWAHGIKGKSGSVRVIYFYYNDTMPLFLLTIFEKNEKIDLKKSELNELAKFTDLLISNYKRDKT